MSFPSMFTWISRVEQALSVDFSQLCIHNAPTTQVSTPVNFLTKDDNYMRFCCDFP